MPSWLLCGDRGNGAPIVSVSTAASFLGHPSVETRRTPTEQGSAAAPPPALARAVSGRCGAGAAEVPAPRPCRAACE